MTRLPGFPYSGEDPNGFMPRAELIEHLERYAASFQAPVRTGVEVKAIAPSSTGTGYVVQTDRGV